MSSTGGPGADSGAQASGALRGSRYHSISFTWKRVDEGRADFRAFGPGAPALVLLVPGLPCSAFMDAASGFCLDGPTGATGQGGGRCPRPVGRELGSGPSGEPGTLIPGSQLTGAQLGHGGRRSFRAWCCGAPQAVSREATGSSEWGPWLTGTLQERVWLPGTGRACGRPHHHPDCSPMAAAL